MVSEPWHRNRPVLPECLEHYLDGVRNQRAISARMLPPSEAAAIKSASLLIVDELRHLSPGQSCFFVQRLADATEDAWQEGG